MSNGKIKEYVRIRLRREKDLDDFGEERLIREVAGKFKVRQEVVREIVEAM